jgi:hypothetical protein
VLPRIEIDDEGRAVEVRTMQPDRATKVYRCPGCGRDIPARTGHLVVVPQLEPDLRRHWHRGCWNARDRRRPLA